MDEEPRADRLYSVAEKLHEDTAVPVDPLGDLFFPTEEQEKTPLLPLEHCVRLLHLCPT